VCACVWWRREVSERECSRRTDRELSNLFIFYHHSTIASTISFSFCSLFLLESYYNHHVGLSSPTYYYTFIDWSSSPLQLLLFLLSFFYLSLSLSLSYDFVNYYRRPDGNPLDLNNLPDDNSSRDHHAKQLLPDTTSPPPGNLLIYL